MEANIFRGACVGLVSTAEFGCIDSESSLFAALAAELAAGDVPPRDPELKSVCPCVAVEPGSTLAGSGCVESGPCAEPDAVDCDADATDELSTCASLASDLERKYQTPLATAPNKIAMHAAINTQFCRGPAGESIWVRSASRRGSKMSGDVATMSLVNASFFELPRMSSVLAIASVPRVADLAWRSLETELADGSSALTESFSDKLAASAVGAVARASVTSLFGSSLA